ncbi:MAG TPA: cyclohexanecarboxylate-CoA ligase [Pseudomonas xinjiangensis]|uniref:Cyclohexanecarboxylate-CoA ligase n=2 Tax=root TaxID=1 RepID=A0A7V1BQY8_9GAMM|nr:cyclohexanecarboxylate-CoA ligase [Halopseudomonas xinjiangensis]HEC47392.1 cyclohexanecarboxylate-CoA ligase [Halopseudomonas xinjiangensis]
MAAPISLPGSLKNVMTVDNPSPDEQLLQASTLWQLLEHRVQRSPSATMLIDAGRGLKLTFAQAHNIAERLAAGFLATGIAPDSVVTWQLPTGVTAVMTALALSRLGCVQNPIIHLYGERELTLVLGRSRSEFLLVPGITSGRDYPAEAGRVCAQLKEPPMLLVMEGELPQGKPSTLPPPPQEGGSVRWVYYTSGTTSDPKGARHTDETLMTGGRNLAIAMAVAADDVGTVAFPYAHIGGAMYTCMLLASGMSAVLLERFVPAEACATFRRYRVTTTGGSTAHYEALLAEQRRQPDTPLLPALKLLCGGGAPKPPDLYFAIRRELGCGLTHNYGMTEVPLVSAGTPQDSDEQLAHTDGMPVQDVEVIIVKRDGDVARPGQEGEIRLRGKGVFKGYTDTALNEEAFDQNGYFRTGDLGVLRADGRLALTGRLKDVIIRKGENISAREIEELLYSHPRVANVAVIGLPDAQRGERVCAVVEPVPGEVPLSFDEMVAFFHAAGVMRQKIPEQLEIMEQLPRNQALNKILKHKLRELFVAG